MNAVVASSMDAAVAPDATAAPEVNEVHAIRVLYADDCQIGRAHV